MAVHHYQNSLPFNANDNLMIISASQATAPFISRNGLIFDANGYVVVAYQ